jgi:hypothetical protein
MHSIVQIWNSRVALEELVQQKVVNTLAECLDEEVRVQFTVSCKTEKQIN